MKHTRPSLMWEHFLLKGSKFKFLLTTTNNTNYNYTKCIEKHFLEMRDVLKVKLAWVDKLALS